MEIETLIQEQQQQRSSFLSEYKDNNDLIIEFENEVNDIDEILFSTTINQNGLFTIIEDYLNIYNKINNTTFPNVPNITNLDDINNSYKDLEPDGTNISYFEANPNSQYINHDADYFTNYNKTTNTPTSSNITYDVQVIEGGLMELMQIGASEYESSPGPPPVYYTPEEAWNILVRSQAIVRQNSLINNIDSLLTMLNELKNKYDNKTNNDNINFINGLIWIDNYIDSLITDLNNSKTILQNNDLTGTFYQDATFMNVYNELFVINTNVTIFISKIFTEIIYDDDDDNKTLKVLTNYWLKKRINKINGPAYAKYTMTRVITSILEHIEDAENNLKILAGNNTTEPWIIQPVLNVTLLNKQPFLTFNTTSHIEYIDIYRKSLSENEESFTIIDTLIKDNNIINNYIDTTVKEYFTYQYKIKYRNETIDIDYYKSNYTSFSNDSNIQEIKIT